VISVTSTKSASAGLMRLRAHVAVHLVAPRMLHRLSLSDVARVLALADGRVVVRDLLRSRRRGACRARVSHVSDRRRARPRPPRPSARTPCLAIRDASPPADGFSLLAAAMASRTSVAATGLATPAACT
jgi:hypothetical protein